MPAIGHLWFPPIHLLQFDLWLIEDFFMPFFDRLAGTKTLREEIIAGVSEADIRKSWKPGLLAYKEMRKKYLIYP